ncbi:MAG: hypothetical protein SVW02_02735 [Candidatus Nanohaloarchaea archaeon]|nr:hypothetical protein [Candidatus Nanohaloarchaea archaeon]
MVELGSFQRRLFTAALLVIGFFFTISGGALLTGWLNQGGSLNQTALVSMGLIGAGFFLLAVVGAMLFEEG